MMKFHTVPLWPMNMVIALANSSKLYMLQPLSHLGATLTVVVSQGLCSSKSYSKKNDGMHCLERTQHQSNPYDHGMMTPSAATL